jgi:hypothetical protein
MVVLAGVHYAVRSILTRVRPAFVGCNRDRPVIVLLEPTATAVGAPNVNTVDAPALT